MQCKELDEVKESLEMNCERHMTLADEFDPTHIQTNLKVAVLEAEEETEQIAEDFLESEFLVTGIKIKGFCAYLDLPNVRYKSWSSAWETCYSYSAITCLLRHFY